MLHRRRRIIQTGRGLGNVLSSLFKKGLPYVKSLLNAGKKLFNSAIGQNIFNVGKKHAAEGGMKLMDDVFKGENVKESLKKNIKSTAENTLKDSATIIQDTVKRKLANLTEPTAKSNTYKKIKNKKKSSPTYNVSKRRKTSDIFSR